MLFNIVHIETRQSATRISHSIRDRLRQRFIQTVAPTIETPQGMPMVTVRVPGPSSAAKIDGSTRRPLSIEPANHDLAQGVSEQKLRSFTRQSSSHFIDLVKQDQTLTLF